MRYVTLDFLQVIPPEGGGLLNTTSKFGENTIIITFGIFFSLQFFYSCFPLFSICFDKF